MITDSYALKARIAEASGQRREGGSRPRIAPVRRVDLAGVYLPTLDETAQLAYMKDVDQPRLHMAFSPRDSRIRKSRVSATSVQPGPSTERLSLSTCWPGRTCWPATPRTRNPGSFLKSCTRSTPLKASLTYGWTPGRRDRTNQLLNRLSDAEANWFQRSANPTAKPVKEVGAPWVELATVRKTLLKDSVLIELIRLQPPRRGRSRASLRTSRPCTRPGSSRAATTRQSR